ncbi:hypothetical protein BSPWISOX_2626 [uncultured Gammaproteobacteria bacterium]|nr:hypothetical protein BSPWISOX_2626 [uncultured Gammaproteobacteria bacterium]
MKNTAKFQLNHFFKNTPSSVFNQFKHFLALSLLITFSFNAFSVDDSQQFNKEAYLDLSKPYKQKNPQSATKKDNQATTILKEVAGTARTALGSTNSGNTDQLGNKITKGVSNQLKNKAINKTEGFVNNKANTFLNAFGAGRSEVSIGGLSSKKLNYSLRTIQPISELDANSKALTFIQASIASGKSIDSRRTTVNLGIGHRLLVEDDMAIAGINVFTDYESKSSHKRLSLGLEYQRANFSVNINKYHVFSDKKLVNGLQKQERAMSGYDVKLSGQAPYLPWAKIKGTYYHWDATTGPNIKGNILGVDIELTPSVSFEFGQENNNTIDATSYGKLTVKLPLGNKQKFTNFAIASKAFKDSSTMDLGALAWVERSNKIMVEGEGNIPTFTGGMFRGLEYQLVTSPNPPHRVWLDRNLGATKVAASSNDSAAYGDHYQWGRAKDGHQSLNSSKATARLSTITADDKFITTFSDWTKVDNNGALRVAAWKDGGSNDICPVGFSVPTNDELHRETLGTTNNNFGVADALSSFLKFPAPGIRNSSDGSYRNVGTILFLWSRTRTAANNNKTNSFRIHSGGGFNSPSNRADGMSIRCIRDL